MLLRDYQIDMLSRLSSAWEHHRSVLVQMPTGTGKTVLMAEAVRRELSGDSPAALSSAVSAADSAADPASVLVVAHRRELIDQIGNTLTAHGIGTDSVTVESIQKLSRASSADRSAGSSPTLVIVDEAHHALARTYSMLWDLYPSARFLGLTATPCRLSGEPLSELFDVMLQSLSIQEFIDRGWLSDFEYVSAAPDSRMAMQVQSLRKKGADGDYQTKEMAAVMDVPESIEHLYRTYSKFAGGRKGIVYAIDREHARHIADYYCDRGVSACVIDSRTPSMERDVLVAGYRNNTIDVLVNVDIFGEGFDVPEVEFIQLARPTLSLSKYMQQVGRGMRTAEGKGHVLILDMVGLYQTFGLPTDGRDWEDYFHGRSAGKGETASTAPVILRDGDSDARELVNLEMVRIRNRSEKFEGLAVYMQGGKYGVMHDGRQTTPAVFERVERCYNGLFYAYGIYPYAIYRSRKTVIDMDGHDLGVQLYGTLTLHGEFLHGKNVGGADVMWDTVGRKYYQGREPRFEHAGWLDLVSVGRDEYELRNNRGLHLFRFRKQDVLFNRHIAIIRDVLVLKSENVRTFRIFGYGGDHVYVCGRKDAHVIPVSWDGRIGQTEDFLPYGLTQYADFEKLQLKSVYGRPAYVDFNGKIQITFH